jgi:hypothetical protein
LTCWRARNRISSAAARRLPAATLTRRSRVFLGLRHLEEDLLQRAARHQLVLQVLERADRGQVALVDDADAPAQALGHVEQMGREEDRLALGGAHANAVLHVTRGARVEPVGRLIENEYGRIVDQRAGESKLLLHAGRVVHGEFLGRVAERQLLEQRAGALLRLAARLAVHLAHEGEDFAAAQVIVKSRIVGQVADPLLHLQAVGLAVEPVDGDASVARHQDAHHHADRGGLAGAVGAEEAEHLSLVDRERKVPHGGKIAVGLADLVELDHGFSRTPSRASRGNTSSQKYGSSFR